MEFEKNIQNFINLNKETIKEGKIDFNSLSEFDYTLADEYLENPKEMLKIFRNILKTKIKIINVPRESFKENIKKIFSIRGQTEQFYDINPFFYDKSKIFWEWDNKEKKYSMCDETDLLNKINENLGIETINSKIKSEIIESLKQIGRKNLPEKPEISWVQFKDRIYDGKTGKFLFEATPEFHFKNPIPWNLGKSAETPTIDNLFEEWVSKENKQELYELFAYSCTPDRFMQRIFALCGGGSNGKGTFVKALKKFMGEENNVSSELKLLSENQFEPAVLYGKLICIMGEVSYGDLKNTNMIKKIAGEDDMSFQFKGKMPFTRRNTALAICLTNSLPATPDKSMGFYRKWKIIDFPNQFEEIKEDLIGKIPDEEFENLAFKCLNILKGLYDDPKFTNEGTFEERIAKYEERSNPVIKFIEEYCKEEIGNNFSLREFTNSCNEYLKKKHLRILSAIQMGKILRNEGFSVGARNIDGVSMVVIINLRLKGIDTNDSNDTHKLLETPQTIRNLSRNLHGKSSENLDSLGRFHISQENYVSLNDSSVVILKNGEPFNLTLERDQKYSKREFGDDAEQTIQILIKEGKIKEK